MTRSAGVVPTLTEVIELALDPKALDTDIPSAPESIALDSLQLAQLMAALQPRLDGWVEARVRAALVALAPTWAEAAAQSIGRELQAALPDLVAQALRDAIEHGDVPPR